jgi:TPP-dependent pyruvate/acetoin dehydrogenase alpha subunit
VPAAEVTEDPLEVLAAVREAADRARRGEGPTLISVGVVRKADPTQLFRPGAPGTPVEISVRGSVPDHDALDAIRRQLLAEGALDESADMLHRRELMAEIEAGVRAALDAGPPAIDSIFEHVHAELAPHLIQQREQLRKVYET